MEKVLSPITLKEAKQTEEVSIKRIIDLYSSDFGMDVTKQFEDTTNLYLYECLDTKFRFFYPFCDGDASFYEELQAKQKLYYPPWKWENQVAYDYAEPSSKVLDIGCGAGFFLAKVKKDKQCEILGLEFNEKAMQRCIENNVNVKNESIQSFAERNTASQDLITFFQVLEHITDIKSFIHAATKALKNGGSLVIGVPNNDPYLYHSLYGTTLNLPPHHAGLWNGESLAKLGPIFNLKVEKIVEQPHNIQSFFANWYRYSKSLFFSTSSDNIAKKIIALPSIFFKILLAPFKNKLKNNTIVAIYKKL
jgi:2-polyprenyl-3-methyl-5-hydroxy-6-metoxy-1,4-benzoquinol methylase